MANVRPAPGQLLSVFRVLKAISSRFRETASRLVLQPLSASTSLLQTAPPALRAQAEHVGRAMVTVKPALDLDLINAQPVLRITLSCPMADVSALALKRSTSTRLRGPALAELVRRIVQVALAEVRINA